MSEAFSGEPGAKPAMGSLMGFGIAKIALLIMNLRVFLLAIWLVDQVERGLIV